MEFIISRNLNNAGKLFRSVGNTGLSGTLRNIRCLCQFDDTRWSNRLYDNSSKRWTPSCHLPIASSLCTLTNLRNHEPFRKNIYSVYYSTAPKNEPSAEPPIPGTEKKVNIFQKMKQLTKDYWHILIPVHIVTSIGWVSIFYIAAKNGVDVIPLMEYLNLSEKYINMIKNSNAGHWAVTYALYKIFTPLRYTVTVGGTTLTIRYLDRLGIMKFPRTPTATPTSSTRSEDKKNPTQSDTKNLKSN